MTITHQLPPHQLPPLGAVGWPDGNQPPAAPQSSPAPSSADSGRGGLAVRIVVRSAFVIAVTGVWLLVYLLGISRIENGRTQHALYLAMRGQLASGLAPVAEPIASGSPIAVMNVPAAGIHDLVVVEGTTSKNLEAGPGHLKGTPLPGQAGATVIFGRARTFGAPFGNIHRLTVGAPITITTGAGTFTYIVESRTTGGLLHIPSDTDGRLVLATGDGSGPFGLLAPNRVLYVTANLSGTAQNGGGALTPAGHAQQAMDTDGSPLTWLLLSGVGELVALTVLGMLWTRRRWGVLQAWLAGVPVIFALALMAGSLSARLLPNLL